MFSNGFSVKRGIKLFVSGTNNGKFGSASSGIVRAATRNASIAVKWFARGVWVGVTDANASIRLYGESN